MKSALRRLAGLFTVILLAGASASLAAKNAASEEKKPSAKASPAAAAKTASGEDKADKPAGADLPDPVAIVGGEKITRAELQQEANQLLAANGASLDMVPPDQLMGIYSQVLDRLITTKLVARASANTPVDEAEIDKEIAGFKKQFPSEDAFRAALAKQNIKESTLREQAKSDVRAQKWVMSQFAGKDEATDADVAKFYEENKAKLEEPETVQASHILIRIPENASDDVVAAKKKEAQAALARVTDKGEDFAAVAKEVSEDPGSKDNGGDLGPFTKDRMVKEFADAAFATKKGETTKEPVRTQFGWHIIKVTDHKQAGTPSLEEVKDKLRGYLQNMKRDAIMSDVLKKLHAEAKVDSKLPAPSSPAGAAPAGADD